MRYEGKFVTQKVCVYPVPCLGVQFNKLFLVFWGGGVERGAVSFALGLFFFLNTAPRLLLSVYFGFFFFWVLVLVLVFLFVKHTPRATSCCVPLSLSLTHTLSLSLYTYMCVYV